MTGHSTEGLFHAITNAIIAMKIHLFKISLSAEVIAPFWRGLLLICLSKDG